MESSAEDCSCEFSFNLPQVNDFSLDATGSAVVFATRHQGAVLAALKRPPEGTPLELQWSQVAGPELGLHVARVAFSKQAPGRRHLAVACGCTISVVDIEGRSGAVDGPLFSRAGSKASPEEVDSIGAITGCLSVHLGPVTALDWSPHSPNLLASCAEDCRFLIWDARQPQPAQTLLSPASWTAAVRWAPCGEFLLATGHEDTVCIWDIRNFSQHMSVLATGQSRIRNVDWSHHEQGKLLSVSANQGTAQAASSGSIKIWDLNSSCKIYDSIDIENGVSGMACFLPKGPVVLAAVESTLVFFQLGGGGRRKASIVRKFDGHEAPVSAVAFAPPPSGSNDPGDQWCLVSVSQAERCCRGWRFRLPRELQGGASRCETTPAPAQASQGSAPRWEGSPTAAQASWALPRSAGSDPALGSAAQPFTSPKSSSSTPVMGPAGLPALWENEPRGLRQDNEATYLGYLALQAARLRRLACSEEVTSCWQALPGQGIKYQLLIEMTTANEIRACITVNVDPAALAARAVWVTAEWAGEWAGTFDGPLAPGVIEDTFRSLSLESLQADGDQLCDCIQALDHMLLRRDGPPRLVWTHGVDDGQAAPAQRLPRAKEKLPMPRTCGVCWSPQGDLLRFHSMQKVAVPFPRRWFATDLRRILKLHREKNLRTLNGDDDDEHTATASRLRLDCTVHFRPAASLYSIVEDHWRTVVATSIRSGARATSWEVPVFTLEPSPSTPRAIDICNHNRQTALAIGRRDLAEVWRLLAVLADDDPEAAEGLRAQPFAVNLVQQIMRQLYHAQETLTFAMVGVVLTSLSQCTLPERSKKSKPVSLASPASSSRQARSVTLPMTEQDSRFSLHQSALTWSYYSRDSGGPDLAMAAKVLGANRHRGIRMKVPHSEDVMARPRVTVSAGGSPMKSISWSPYAEELGLTLEMVHKDLAANDRIVKHTSCQHALEADHGTAVPKPCINYSDFAQKPVVDLLPQDAPTLECLISSAHAHCDLLHRLGEFGASRLLAKLLWKLQSHHCLPPLQAEFAFGAFSSGLAPKLPMEMWDALRDGRPPGALAVVSSSRGSPTLSNSRFSFRAFPGADMLSPAAARAAAGPALRCAVCWLRLRGLTAPCWSCGHSFHIPCLRRWFTSEAKECPVLGCNCRCQELRPLDR